MLQPLLRALLPNGRDHNAESQKRLTLILFKRQQFMEAKMSLHRCRPAGTLHPEIRPIFGSFLDHLCNIPSSIEHSSARGAELPDWGGERNAIIVALDNRGR